MDADRGRRTEWTGVVLAATLVLPGVACASDGQGFAPTSASTSASASTVSAPAIPPGGKDCGTSNQLSGWPNTTAPNPDAFTCIAEAVASGTPARMIVISAGQRSSGRKTSDGYDIPTHQVVTWVVLGKGKVQQTTDLREDGAGVTTVVCAGLSAAGDGSAPAGTGCQPT